VPIKQKSVAVDDGSTTEVDPFPFAGGSGRTMAWLTREFANGLAEVDITATQYRILILLSNGSAMSSALADRLAVSPPSVTSAVDGLVNRGLVSRDHDKTDRRRIALGLTKEGVRALAQADHAADALFVDIAAAIGDSARSKRMIDDLELWNEALATRRRNKKAAKDLLKRDQS
jgi:DNA-binding MarR family transcriptional regulator